MEKKQSSIEWLNVELTSVNFDYLTGQVNNSEFSERNKLIMEQAKAMHKEEIRVAYMDGAFEKIRHLDGKEFIMPTDYYNETFGGNNG